MPQTLRTVGRYEIVREVGRGGMATVYLARQIGLDRDVALKELGSLYLADDSFGERFVRESRVAGSLSHPNIVTVYDFFEHDGVPYIAMEYVPRGSLRPLVGALDLPQTVGVLEGVLAGLAHAARRQIVHRDLKPENLMISAEGAVKIADFGIAKALGGASSNLTQTGMAIGTPRYMAPEQVLGDGVSPATDLYATGVIAFELLTGRVPFEHDEALPLLFRHVNAPVPDIRSFRPDLDPRLEEWVASLLAKAPADRPPTPAAAWEALEETVIAILGPRWRRDSILPDAQGTGQARPDTPQPAVFPVTPSRAAPTETALPAAPSTVRGMPGRRRRVRSRALAVPVAIALAAGGTAAALLVGRGGGSATTTSRVAAPPPRPVTVRLSRPVIRSSGRRIQVRIPFAGGSLRRRDLTVGSLAIATGRSAFTVADDRLAPAVAGSRAHGLTVSITHVRGATIVRLRARRGAFLRMSRPRLGARAITFTVTKARPRKKLRPPSSTTRTTPAAPPVTTAPPAAPATTPPSPATPSPSIG